MMKSENDVYDYDGKIRDIYFADVMKNGFLDYAISVIVSRAIPYVRDGLKPVHRRINYLCNLRFKNDLR